MARRWKLLILIATVAIVALAYDQLFYSYWIGSTDLEIQFVVTDAKTGHSIRGARVAIITDGASGKDEQTQGNFTLTTDSAGIARTVQLEIPCCGEQSGLRLTNTFSPYLPYWRIRTTSPGYLPSSTIDLNTTDNIRRTERLDSGHAKLVVLVPLRKEH